MGGDSNSETTVIQVEEEREAEFVETTDHFFDKIGESVPLTPNVSSFDLQNPPSRPLAVSERFRLIFVAHPSDGFFVAKTADVINLAKDIKSGASSSSILDASVVHVSVGRVSILSLSTDSSTLAASVAGDIHFFSVKSLLAKEKQPFLSLSVESPNYVKYISWTKKRDMSFVVLSNAGTLYGGDLQNQQQPLKHVMDDVDAVDWSLKGGFLAVARKQIVSILTPEFNERNQIRFQFKSGFTNANDGGLTVDSIQWVRPDCIVLGCLQKSADGGEENYLVQAITCGNGEEITDASSRPVILCLSDLFLGIIDDIMPFGYGPHLLLSYLEARQLAVLANRKNTDQHIVLVGWLDESDGPAVIQIERDNWLPRIELQENGDDNVILGMCIDRASVYENIEVKVSMDDQRELSPFCIFLCLTNEGKLVIFHFASISGDSGAPSAVSVPFDEEEAISTTGALDSPTISVEQTDDKIRQVVIDLQSRDTNRDKPAAAGVDQKYFQKNRETSFTEKSSTSLPEFDRPLTTEGRTTGMWMTTTKDQLGPSPLADVDKRIGGGQSWPIGNERLSQNTFNSFAGNASKFEAENFKEADKLNLFGTHSDYPLAKNYAINSNVSSHGGNSKSYVELGKRESRSNQPTLVKDAPEQAATNFSGSFSSFGTVAVNAGKATSVPTNVTMGTQSLQMKGPLLPGKALTHSNFEMSLSKKYGNVKDMTSELDKLLQCIEEPGGFIDTCTSSQKLLENLEKDMMVLCHKCTTWQSLLHEQADSIQHLLDNTLQVLARKVYMEGIVKQTRDKQYWDLWNRQKLSSELKMKRHSMINLSQDLINQLIELEKHFNVIELKNYGESNEDNFGRQSIRSKYAPSRRIQSLHAVHNALNSQLAAAEQLSESLSKQMTALSIKSSSVKPDNVKDQLFKMIGIPCESHSEISSHSKRMVSIDTPQATPLFSSVAGTIGNDFKSNQFGTGNHEPETARRRRDSFDQNWTNFEPSKTTIKRMLRGNARPDVQRPSLFMDKRLSISSNAEGSVIACFSGHANATQVDMFDDARGTEDTSNNFLPTSSSRSSRDKDLYEPNASNATRASRKQTVDERNLGAFSPDVSKYSGALGLHVKKETHQATAERPYHERTNIENPESALLKERKTGFTVAQPSQDQENFHRAHSLVFPFSKTYNNTLMSYNSKDHTTSKRAGNVVEEKVSMSSPIGCGSYQETESSHILSLSDQHATFSQSATPTSGVLSSEALTTSSTTVFPTLSSSVFDSASKSLFSSLSTPTAQKVSSTMATGSLNSTTSNQDKFRLASQPTRLTFSSAPSVASLSSLSSTKSVEKAPSSMASSTDSSVKTLNIEHQSSVDRVHAGPIPSDASSFNPADTQPSKSHEMSASSPVKFSINPTFKSPNRENQSSATKLDAGILQKELPTSGVNWNTSTFTGSSDVASKVLASGSHLTPSSSATHGSDVVSNTEAKKSSGLFVFPQTPVSTSDASTVLASGSHLSPSSSATPGSSLVSNTEAKKSSGFVFPQATVSILDDKSADSAVVQEDEMEEEDVDTSQAASLSLGSFGSLGFGSGANTNSGFNSNPFGVSSVSTSPTAGSPAVDRAVPSGQLFRPASFSFQTLRPSQPSSQAVNAGGFGFGSQAQAPSASSLGQPAQIGSGQQALGSVLAGSPAVDRAVPSGQLFRPASFSFQTLQPSQPSSQAVNAGGFGFGSQAQAPSASSLGQPAQIGSGQQALGSVLGSFGQSRQLGPALPASNFGGGGFAGVGGQSGGGFLNNATSSGFSGNSAVAGGFAAASATGGFAALSSGGAGFAGVSAPAGGFAGVGATGSGFPPAAAAAGGGGFGGAVAGGGGIGAFSNQGSVSGGGFSSFGSGLGGKQPPSQLFTQMRK